MQASQMKKLLQQDYPQLYLRDMHKHDRAVVNRYTDERHSFYYFKNINESSLRYLGDKLTVEKSEVDRIVAQWEQQMEKLQKDLLEAAHSKNFTMDFVELSKEAYKLRYKLEAHFENK